MISIFKKNFYIILLFLIAILTHLQWFNFFSILTHSDWYFWPNEATKQLWNSWGTWINYLGLGTVNIQLPFNLFTSIWSIFTNVGLSYDISTKITFLIPIAILGFLSPYILIKKLTENDLISFCGSLIYGSTSYFLVRQTAHIPIAFVYSFLPLLLYFYFDCFEKNQKRNWIIFAILYSISACYEIRITYIISFIFIIYFIYFRLYNLKRYWKNILMSIFIFVGLNVFWIFPVVFGKLISSIIQVANRGLFGNSLFDMMGSLTLFDSAWTGNIPNSQFIKQKILIHFWFIPIIAFFSLIIKKIKYKKKVIFFVIITLCGIFFSKQSAFPFPTAYLWLYNNFPGFNLFREASKFYILTAVGYTTLASYGLLMLNQSTKTVSNKFFYISSVIVIILISFLNLKPLITGEIKTMFIQKKIPNDYIILNKFILSKPNYFRTFWLPSDSRWSIYTNTHPKVSTVGIIGATWKDLNSAKSGVNEQNRISMIINNTFSNKLIDNSSIKYIIVPLQDKANDDDFFIYYGKRNDYIKILDKVKWLKKIDIGTRELVIYENEEYRPHIYLTKNKESIYKINPFSTVLYTFINPTEYRISLKKISHPLYINYSEAYHPDWKLRVGDFNWFKVLTDKNYFISDKYHSESDTKLNSFYIDPRAICKSYECKRNSDGSYDISLTLYFRPQSYMYLGLIISGTTLFVCLSYLGFLGINKLKKKKMAKYSTSDTNVGKLNQ